MILYYSEIQAPVQPTSGTAINFASRRFSPDAIFTTVFLEARKQFANLPNAALSPGNLEK
jgi:hypothetical protein